MTEEKKSVDIASPSDVEGEAEVDANNPWKDDALERKKFAKHLTNLVSSAGVAPFCIAVDGEWGSGKTFFLKRWCIEFSEPGKVIYFDAWADDFHADPLTAIIGQLWKKMRIPEWKEIYDLWEEKYIAFVMRKIMKKIFKSAVWKFVRKQKHISIMKKALKSVLCRKYIAFVTRRSIKYFGLRKDDLQTGVGEAVDEYLGTRKNIDEVKERLVVLARETKKKTGSPLVIVVDELDRCRPTFAIELLERVKHVVGVPGVVFVFGVNLKELEKSIKSVYGDIDSEDYLRRFFHPPFLALPQAGASKYCQYLMDKQGIVKKIEENPAHKKTPEKSAWISAMKIMPPMAGYMELSLRQTEQAVSMLLFILNSQEITDRRDAYEFEGHLTILILLRIKDRDLYENFFDERRTVQNAINVTMGAMFNFLPWEKIRGNEASEVKHCIVVIMLAFYSFYGDKERHNFKKELQRAYNELHGKEKLSGQYDHMPSRIIEIQGLSARQEVVSGLAMVGEYLAHNRQSFYASREKIAQLLEWGDYWQE